MQLRWSGCGSFEARFPTVSVAFDPYFFDETLAAAEPVHDYIFITHEHFDHCHPPPWTGSAGETDFGGSM